MKRKLVQLLIGASALAALTGVQAFTAAAEEIVVEESAEEMQETEILALQEGEVVEVQAETPAAEPAVAEPASEIETEIETETETEDDFIEGSALLSDCGWEAGVLSEKGWESKFLNMKFTPDKKMTMDIEDNEQLAEYYERHGQERMVASSEMVAKDSDDGYVQMTVVVNPNSENAEDVLDRFAEIEKLELVSKAKDTKIADKNFKTCTGIFEREKYMIGVCTEQDDVAIAIKIKYKDTDARKALLACFEALETEEETEAETAVEAESEKDPVSEKKEGMTLITPNEFEEEELISEAESEAETGAEEIVEVSTEA